MREWNRKPYISKSYFDMMKKVTNRAKWNQKLEKQSEFEKPYRDEDYAEMQHYHHSNFHLPGADYPGMPVGGIPQDNKYNVVFFCTPSPCYCVGQTKYVDMKCTQPIVGITTHFCDPCISATLAGNRIYITVPSGCNVADCRIEVHMEATYAITLVRLAPFQKGYYSKTILLPDIVAGHHGLILGECDDCCNCDGISIGYTTQGMAVDEEQELTVEGAKAGCTYTWAIASGGGELSSNEGTSVTYTAPSSNANCASNPTITLSVEGNVCDTLAIAVNAYVDTDTAYETFECLYIHPWWRTLVTGYYCDGSVEGSDYWGYFNTEQLCLDAERGYQRCNCDGTGYTLHDCRPADCNNILTSGCCPEALL